MSGWPGLCGTFRLPPLPGAVLLRALRAAAADLGLPGAAGPGGVSAETPPPPGGPVVATSSDLADALAVVAEAFVAGKVAGAEDAEAYQVVVHVGAGPDPAAAPSGVSAETPPPSPESPPAPGDRVDPADPARCHVQDGPAIRPATAEMLACTAALVWMRHGPGGTVLDLGRTRRRPSAALRKAARDRDHGRCCPGCESRTIDLHHIRHWASGGRTSLENLLSLCRSHHVVVHDRGYLIAARQDGAVTFSRPDGTPVPASPPLPSPDGGIAAVHDADITAETIIPPWYGERLDLDYALCTCLANEQVRAGRAAGRDSSPGDVGSTARRGAAVFKPGNWYPLIRQYDDETSGATGPRISYPDWLDQRTRPAASPAAAEPPPEQPECRGHRLGSGHA